MIRIIEALNKITVGFTYTMVLVGLSVFPLYLSAQVDPIDEEDVTTEEEAAVAEEVAVASTPARDTVVLEGFIQQDQTLSSDKVYVIKHNVLVSKNATLSAGSNTTILFAPDKSLVIEGGLQFIGEPYKFIELTSLEPEDQGTGLLIRGDEGDNIVIRYCRISKLTTPINFEMDWYRSSIKIEDNIFTEYNSGESNILITSPLTTYQATSVKKAQLVFSRNNFVNNWGSIFIENFQDNILDLRFNNNLVTNNVVYGIDLGIPSNTPVFGLYDDEDKRFLAELSGNSIYGNYQINAATDTIIREISFGIQGEGESFAIPNNFFRSREQSYVSSTLDHFYQNNQLPLFTVEPVLYPPAAVTHGHIYKVVLDGDEIFNYDKVPESMGNSNVKFDVYFNRPVNSTADIHLEEVFYDTVNNTIDITNVDITNGSFSEGNTVFSFTVEDASVLKNALGYLVITNYEDYEGFEVPDFTIGQQAAINNYGRLYQAGLEDAYFSTAELVSEKPGFYPDTNSIETLEQLVELGDLSYLGEYTSLAKTWEVGIFGGTANYLGEMAFKFMDKDQFRWSGGVWGQYNISKWFSARLALTYGRIYGEDITDSDLGRRRRLGNFRNDIYEGALTFHIHLLQYGISKGEKFSPHIFGGISVFKHNPQGRIFIGQDEVGDPAFYQVDGRDVWFDLQPIGTEGQTSNLSEDPEANSGGVNSDIFKNRTPPEQYKLIQVAFPFGVGFDFIINKKWVIGAEIGFRLTLTDYLDDVSGYYFDRINDMQAIVDANPSVVGRVGSKPFNRGTEQQFDLITVTTTSGDVETFHVAQLLANPSLINGTDPGDGPNDASSFPDARRGDINRDWIIWAGIKVSKVLGYKRLVRRAEKKNDDYEELY